MTNQINYKIMINIFMKWFGYSKLISLVLNLKFGRENAELLLFFFFTWKRKGSNDNSNDQTHTVKLVAAENARPMRCF